MSFVNGAYSTDRDDSISQTHPSPEANSPNPAGLGSHHRRGLFATEAPGKLRQVGQHGVGPVLVGRVRVGLRLTAQLLWARLRTPLLRIGNPEPLIGSVAVGLGLPMRSSGVRR